jgi:hypothetical protein
VRDIANRESVHAELEDALHEMTTRGEEAVAEARRRLVERFGELASGAPGKTHAAVDDAFDAVAGFIASQRELVHSLVDTVFHAADARRTSEPSDAPPRAPQQRAAKKPARKRPAARTPTAKKPAAKKTAASHPVSEAVGRSTI